MTGNFFEGGGGKSFFLIFSQREMFFPVENFQFGRPKTNFSGFEKWKAKKKNFPFFPCLIFPNR